MPVPDRKRPGYSSRSAKHKSQVDFHNRKSKKRNKTDSGSKNEWDPAKTEESQRCKMFFSKENMHNEAMEKYYKMQNLFANSSDYDKMFSTFRKGLPTTFRFTGIKQEAIDARHFMQTVLLPKMENFEVNGEIMESPKPIEWYPLDLAWNFEFPRSVLRKSPELKRFHQYMISETEMGNISRQEAVSMIPVLFLDVRSHHYVLDTCASPGSKTTQILEALHTNTNGKLPTGIVIANDVNYKRAAMLVHQTQRVSSPALIVTNHEAQHFPSLSLHNIEGTGTQKLTFDRILCDVPCSGDGTLRKNIDVWQSWSGMNGNSLHRTQLQILMRSIQLLTPGGRIVYSTCSMNPVENEAVIAEALKRSYGTMKLIDQSKALPRLKRHSGLTTWQVMAKDGTFYSDYDSSVNAPELGKTNRRSLVPSLFASENVNLELEKCMRFYPHDQDTGAFFVAVLEKVGELESSKSYDLYVGPPRTVKDKSCSKATAPVKPDSSKPDNENEKAPELSVTDESSVNQGTDSPSLPDRPDIPSRPKKPGVVCRRNESNKDLRGWFATKGYSEEPFVFVPTNHPDVDKICSFFNLDAHKFPRELLIVRGDKVRRPDRLNQIYFASKAVERVLTALDSSKLRVVNCGLKILSRNDKLLVHLLSQKERQLTNVAEGASGFNLLENLSKEDIGRISCFRLNGDGLNIADSFFEARKVQISRSELVHCLREMNPKIESFSDSVKKSMVDCGPGALILQWTPSLSPDGASESSDGMEMHAPISISSWLGFSSLNIYVNKHERKSLFLKLTGEVLPDTIVQPQPSQAALPIQADEKNDN